MYSWQRERNYRKIKNSDGTFTCVITVDGIDVEVTEEVYKVYSQADRRERYMEERETGILLSLDQLEEDGVPALDTNRYALSAEDTAIQKLHGGKTMEALNSLESDEIALIKALIFEGATERDYAAKIGISQKGVNKRKKKILEKLKVLVLKQ